MRTKRMVLFVASVVFGVVAANSETASAIFKRQHAVTCWWDNVNGANSPMVPSGLGVSNNNAGTSMIVCPAIDDTALPKSQQLTLRVDGFDGNASTNASFQACVTFATTAGGECGLSTTTSGTGSYSLNVTTLRWQLNDAHYGYLTARIPAKDPVSGAASYFRGYQASNP
jgi:hypothetical protein